MHYVSGIRAVVTKCYGFRKPEKVSEGVKQIHFTEKSRPRAMDK